MKRRQELFRRRAQGRPEGARPGAAALRRAGPRHRQDGLFRRPHFPGHAPPEDGAQPASSRPHQDDRHVRGGEASGRRARAHPQGRAAQCLHDPDPDPGRAGGRAGAGRRQGALEGRGGGRRAGRQRARRQRGRGQGQDRLRGAAGRLRHRRGAEARRADRQRIPRPELLHLRQRRHRGRCASATSRRASPRPTTSSSRPTGPRRSSRRRRRRPAASSRPRATTASPATPTRRRCSSRSTTPRSSCRCPATSCIWSAARSAAASAARSTSPSSRSPSSPPSSPAGRSPSSTAARRRCRFPRRARPRRSCIKDGVMKDGRIVARQGHRLHRRRRLFAPFALWRAEGRGALSRPLHDPECLDRHLLRLHQPHAVLGHARLRRHHRRLRAGGADGQAGAADRHGPARVPLHQRLSRRRHEGASPADRRRGADRMHAGSLARRQLAGRREVSEDVVLRGEV